jgi:hypothetical protein
VIEIPKQILKSPYKFKEKLSDFIKIQIENIQKIYNVYFNFEELSDLLLSACRSNDFNVLYFERRKLFINEDKISEWIHKKLLPNTIVLKIDDEDILRLLIFCIEITYQMFSGGTRATITAKAFRERRRTFESILVDQFVGKLGEVILKKFLEQNFPGIKIELDWRISTQLEKHKNDIINAKKKISIKSTPTLAGIWAEADIGYDYGIMVKCSVPKQPILQFFIEVCGFKKLIDFVEGKIPTYDTLFRDYLKSIKNRICNFKCEEIRTELKGFVCGYFKTSEYEPVEVGKELPYMGKIREKRHLVNINELKYEKSSWRAFLQDTGLMLEQS